ncbi:MAG: SMC-Scp complex subunit ScpB, partial [Stenotrophomonas koreensis]
GLAALDQLPPLHSLQDSAAALAAANEDFSTATTPLDEAPDAAPGTRAAEHHLNSSNAAALTPLAVEQADVEPEGRPARAGRSQIDE